MSQEKLGEALGLTFQQVQKYEKGANRMGASRLLQISDVLTVPLSFFFDGSPTSASVVGDVSEPVSSSYVSDFLGTSEGLALARAFTHIPDPKLRRSIVELVERIGDFEV